jgi:hypothetical protein
MAVASLRKRSAERIEVSSSPRQDGPPVTTMPQETAAQPPDPVADPKPPEPIVETSPAEEAGKAALRQRLQEMERAEALTRQVQQQPQLAEEPQPPTLEQVIAHLPERVQRWYRNNPDFLTNPEKAAQIQYCHHVAARETGEQFTDPYFDRMEQMLGLAPRPSAPQPQQQSRPQQAAPQPRPQPRTSTPVSAPPTRDVPSITTGRPTNGPMRLTEEEIQLARTIGLSPQKYAEEKAKMLQMKAAGTLDDRR